MVLGKNNFQLQNGFCSPKVTKVKTNSYRICQLQLPTLQTQTTQTCLETFSQSDILL
jgi:hypothetical protein